MKFFRIILRLAGLALLTTAIFLVSCQSKLIYYPRQYQASDLDNFKRLGGRQIEITTSQGRQVAFYLPPRNSPAQRPEFLWLVFGGNGALSLDYSREAAGWDAASGYLFVDYPGYGLSEGSPSPSKIGESIIAFAEKMKEELHWSDKEFTGHTCVFGHSFGCAAGLIAMERFGLRRGVLCSPFTTMTDMARRLVGWPLCHLNHHRFDNISRMENVTSHGGRLKILHGRDDTVIPVTMSEELNRMFPDATTLLELPGVGHNDIVLAATAEIRQAMRELTGQRPR